MKNRKQVFALIAVVLAAVLLWGAYSLWMPKGVSGKKQIEVTVVHADGQQKVFPMDTEQEYLRGALEDQHLIAGQESQYGLFVVTVDGYTVKEENQEWWCFTKAGESITTGVDATPIADGDRFEITLTVGY